MHQLTIEMRSNGFAAYLRDRPQHAGYGQTQADAVSDFIWRHADLVGVQMTEINYSYNYLGDITRSETRPIEPRPS